MNEAYYYDAPADDENVLIINNIDPDRKYGGDPFDILAALEEENGCPIALN